MKSALLILALAGAAWADLGVAERAQDFLAPGPQVRLIARGSVAETTMPAGPLVWKCTVLAGLESPNPRVRVEVSGQGGKRSWLVAFDKQVQASQKLTLHALAAGTPLREEDFHSQEVWVPAHLVGSAAYSGAYDGRYRVRRAVPAQAALAAAWVEAVPFCESGCQVDIHVRQPGLALTLTGRSLEKGYPDRPLRVRLDNGLVMQAWYDKDGQLSDRRTP